MSAPNLLRRVSGLLPPTARERLDPFIEAAEIVGSISDPRVASSLGPSGVRGLLLQRGKRGEPTQIPSAHVAHFDWTYPTGEKPEMLELYRRAKEAQWDGETKLDWRTSVDPLNPEIPLLPHDFFAIDKLESFGVRLTDTEKFRLGHDMAAWMLSQFLHGEQGALFAAAQVTEAVHWYDAKLYGATQVMDEARHVEVFHRYLATKLEKVYQINDNLYTIIDALISDGRWDMKFLGMQIMVEGLALGAFGMLYQMTHEPLLKDLLKYVIQDESRHVHYGVLALRDHFTRELGERERREREDWTFEVALLMRNRFLMYEVYEEWFTHKLTRAQWREVVYASPGLEMFRHTMFRRLVPNLRAIGLLSDRIKPHYDRVGLLHYMEGKAADELDFETMMVELDRGASAANAA